MLEMVASQQQRQFGLDKRDTLPQFCLECDVRFACHGGCPEDRFIRTPNGDPGLNYLCVGFKDFFHHVDPAMRFMADRCASTVHQPTSSPVRGGGREARPQRPLHLRLGSQVEALPRRRCDRCVTNEMSLRGLMTSKRRDASLDTAITATTAVQSRLSVR